MTSLKLISAAAVLSALIAAPATAQPVVSEPGMEAFVHPNSDLGIGSPWPAFNAQAQAQSPKLIMRHPLPVSRLKPSK
jgi:hypothetical protein